MEFISILKNRSSVPHPFALSLAKGWETTKAKRDDLFPRSLLLQRLMNHLRIPKRRRGQQQCIDPVQHAAVPGQQTS